MIKNYICIFSKPPIAGKTKNRLAKDIGNELAAELSAAMLFDITGEMIKIESTSVCIFYPPDFAPADYKFLNQFDLTFFPQTGNDLGERMSNAFKLLLTVHNAEKVIIVGGDCISHTKELLNEAFANLKENQLVIQPAEDGGYTLIGQSTFLPELFKNIHWGSESVMETSRQIINANCITCLELPETFDIDTSADLHKLEKHLQNTSNSKCCSILQKIQEME